MFNVKTDNGNIIQLDFDVMTDKELDDLENSIFLYKRERKEKNIQKSIDTIISCIETEMKKCPALKDRTAILVDNDDNDDGYYDWFDLLSMIKDAYE